ncbi:MAG: sigma-70 family RNA polymerase sigma factor [Clostridiaceae bacterium]|nr:sigma-70 family RNA polymerase sigma factor [Clostridiaceae bacterium]
MEEKELIKRIKKQDEEAFRELVDLYKNKIYSLCFSMLKNEHDAEDAAQETFIKVYTKIGKFKEDSTLYTWIYKIATNTCLDYIRKNKRAKIVSINETDEDGKTLFDIVSPSGNPEEGANNALFLEELKKAIDKLPPDMKTAVVLRDIHDIPYQEIAQITNSNLGTVKSRISRGRAVLKKLLSQWEHLSEKSVKEVKGGAEYEM